MAQDWAAARVHLQDLRDSSKLAYDKTSGTIFKLITLLRDEPKNSTYFCVNKNWGGLDVKAGREVMACIGYKEQGASLVITKTPTTMILERGLRLLTNTKQATAAATQSSKGVGQAPGSSGGGKANHGAAAEREV